ncbi:MAG: tetrahydromethanopterin S-methyltransferase subunit C [Methanotrichaceae archaeon]|nr:tetrahydromethanopterin S-methyltransferase subunit C [Methanotrichaceae archaeon]
MSVAAGGGAPSKVEPMKLRIYGVVGGLVGIYLASLLGPMTGNWASFIAALGVIPAVVLGANSVRRVCSYGIGTGVPSIGMLALGMGIVAAMFGLAIGGVIGPILGTAIAMGFGYLIGLITNKAIKFNIPVMEEGTMDLGGAGAITLLGLSVAVSGSADYAAIQMSVIATGYIAVVFIAGSLAILHPFNANLGPDETQDRTLTHAISTAALAIVAAGICGIGTIGLPSVLTVIVGFLVWIVYFKKFFQLVKRDAAGVVGTGLLPPSAQ